MSAGVRDEWSVMVEKGVVRLRASFLDSSRNVVVELAWIVEVRFRAFVLCTPKSWRILNIFHKQY